MSFTNFGFLIKGTVTDGLHNKSVEFSELNGDHEKLEQEASISRARGYYGKLKIPYVNFSSIFYQIE